MDQTTTKRIRVRTRPPAKHVRYSGFSDFRVKCLHCAAEMTVPKALNMFQIARIAIRWDYMHRRCPKPPPPPPKAVGQVVVKN